MRKVNALEEVIQRIEFLAGTLIIFQTFTKLDQSLSARPREGGRIGPRCTDGNHVSVEDTPDVHTPQKKRPANVRTQQHKLSTTKVTGSLFRHRSCLFRTSRSPLQATPQEML